MSRTVMGLRFVLLLVVLLVGSMSMANGSGVSLSSQAAGRVKVAYYVEAYCARCIDVLTHSLVDAIKRVGDIVDLEVVPFGNGEEKGGVVTCQHGAKECHANKLQGCAQKYYPDRSIWFPFIVCMEKQMDPLAAGAYCARKHQVDFSKVENCAVGKEGETILYSNARKTLDLSPPNKYVPWITVNGKPFEDPENIVAAICSQYTFADKNDFCGDTSRYQA